MDIITSEQARIIDKACVYAVTVLECVLTHIRTSSPFHSCLRFVLATSSKFSFLRPLMLTTSTSPRSSPLSTMNTSRSPTSTFPSSVATKALHNVCKVPIRNKGEAGTGNVVEVFAQSGVRFNLSTTWMMVRFSHMPRRE